MCHPNRRRVNSKRPSFVMISISNNVELLLNVLWLLLVIVPELCHRCRRVPRRHSRAAVLAFICSVVLLFPVISASDDLQRVGGETEESAGKEVTKRSGSTSKHQHAQPSFCQIPSSLLPVVLDVQGTILLHSVRLPQLLGLKERSGRGPPNYSYPSQRPSEDSIFCS
jgi:hypothetical protein